MLLAPLAPPPVLRADDMAASEGRYDVLQYLATGGMAELFLARRVTDDADELCVVKRIQRRYATDRHYVAMFLDEARAASTLDHPNLVRVLDVGRMHGRYYYAMEYVEGVTVVDLLLGAARGRLALRAADAVSIIAAAAAGLHAAHEACDARGRPLALVHRDVSPSNLLLRTDGVVKVIDFGIATADGRMTRTAPGVIKGKASYLSPEQCQGQPVDRRSDVFSLGVVAWEMLTGRRLFSARSEYGAMAEIVGGAVPVPSSVADVPAALDAPLLRALTLDRRDRYPTAAAFAQALVCAAAAHGGCADEPTLATMATRARTADGTAPERPARRRPRPLTLDDALASLDAERH